MDNLGFRLCFTALLVLFAGCQSHTVHVFYETLAPNRQAQLIEELEKSKINYQLSPIAPESDYDSPTLLHYPGDLAPTTIDILTNLVKRLGFERLDIQLFNGHRHFYTQGHQGLYFPQSSKKQSLPNLLYSHDCPVSEHRLHLLPGNRWRMEDSLDSNRVFTGQFQYHSPYLTLVTDDGAGPIQQVYEALYHEVKTPHGPKDAVTYQVLGHRRYPFNLFNCDLQVIFAE